MLSRLGIKAIHRNRELLKLLLYSSSTTTFLPNPIHKQYTILNLKDIPNALKQCEERLLKSERKKISQVVDQILITLETLSRQINSVQQSQRSVFFKDFVSTIKMYQQKILGIIKKSDNSIQQNKRILLKYLLNVGWWIINRVQDPQLIKICIQTTFQLGKNSVFKDVFTQIQALITSNEDVSLTQAISLIPIASYLKANVQTQFYQKLTPYVSIISAAQCLRIICNDLFLDSEIPNQCAKQLNKNKHLLSIDFINHSYFKLLFIKKKLGSNRIFIQQSNFIASWKNLFQFDRLLTLIRLRKMCQMFIVDSKISNKDFNSKFITFGINLIIKTLEKKQLNGVQITIDNYVEFYALLSRVYPIGTALISQITRCLKEKQLTLSTQKQKINIYEQFLRHLLKNTQSMYAIDKNEYLNKQINDQVCFVSKVILQAVLPHKPQLIFEIEHFRNIYPNINLSKYTHQALMQARQLSLTSQLNYTLKVLNFISKEPNYVLNKMKLYQIKIDLKNIAKDYQSANSEHYKIPYLLYLIQKDKMQTEQFKKDQMGNKFYKFIFVNLIRRKIQVELQSKKFIHIQSNYFIDIFFVAVELNKILYSNNAEIFTENYLLIEAFLNKSMVPQIKSISVFLFSKFIDVVSQSFKPSAQVLQSFFAITSKLIVYSTDKGKYFINPFFSEEFYIKLIKFALTNKHQIAKIQQKQILRPLQTIFFAHRRKFDSNSVLQMLQILQLPKYLTPAMKGFLQKVPFTKQQFSKIDHQLIKNFEYCNQWIETMISNNLSVNLNELKQNSNIVKRIANLSKQQQKQLLGNPQFFRILFQMPAYQPTELDRLPEPISFRSNYENNQKQMVSNQIYICLRMYVKVKKHFNFELQHIVKSGFKKQEILKLNFDQEIQYLKQKGLLASRSSVNLFHIDQRTFSPQFCLELWKDYDIKNAIQVQDFLSQKQVDISIFSNIIACFSGRTKKIQQILAQYTPHTRVTYQVMKLNYQYDQAGALIQVYDNNSQKDTQIPIISNRRVLLLCYSQSNYKTLYLCAYLLHEKGYNVCLVGKDYKQNDLAKYLEKQLKAKKSVTKEAQDQQQSQDETTAQTN